MGKKNKAKAEVENKIEVQVQTHTTSPGGEKGLSQVLCERTHKTLMALKSQILATQQELMAIKSQGGGQVSLVCEKEDDFVCIIVNSATLTDDIDYLTKQIEIKAQAEAVPAPIKKAESVPNSS